MTYKHYVDKDRERLSKNALEKYINPHLFGHSRAAELTDFLAEA
ncbi:MAG: hypothetical protein ACTSR0_06400 [Candidatus Asgardarchaeia archaeon]